jgi:hypothetical protein
LYVVLIQRSKNHDISFTQTCENFLENYKALTYKDEISNILNAYNKRRFQMSLKMYFLHSYLNFFPENVGTISDEQSE